MDATDWDDRYAARELVWSAGPNQFVASEVADLTPGRALDVATGEGRNAIWLAEQGWTVTAVDFSSVGLDKARQLADARGVEVDWRVGDVTTWPAPREAFDLVLVVYLQLPAAERVSVHRIAASAVAPGGTLLVVAHDRDNLARGVGGPPDPSVLPTADDVRADLEGTGLVVERAEQVEREVETDDGPRTAIDCLVRAHRP